MRSAMRAAARTSFSAPGRGPTQARIASRVSHTGPIALSCR